MPLPAGHAGPSKPAAATPPKPSTLIRYVGSDGKQGDSTGSTVMELPPGGNAIVIDGRLQIYRPTAPPKDKKAAKREIAGQRNRNRNDTRGHEENRGVIDIGGQQLDIADILRQAQ